MHYLERIRKVYDLKKVNRINTIAGKRAESSAEHSWSCLILADYFLPLLEQKIDRLKVYELLIYHDVVEIEAGDCYIGDYEKRISKEIEEKKAILVLRKELAEPIGERLNVLFNEFEEQKTIESRFAKAIDRMDSIFEELDNPNGWKGWDEEFARKIHQKYYEEFPVMKKVFEELVSYAYKKGLFRP